VEHSVARLRRDVERAELALAGAPVGTRVVTYLGFGGKMPPEYLLAMTESIGPDALRLWIKQ
jgi:hypothetical protein